MSRNGIQPVSHHFGNISGAANRRRNVAIHPLESPPPSLRLRNLDYGLRRAILLDRLSRHADEEAQLDADHRAAEC